MKTPYPRRAFLGMTCSNQADHLRHVVAECIGRTHGDNDYDSPAPGRVGTLSRLRFTPGWATLTMNSRERSVGSPYYVSSFDRRR